MMVVGRLSKKQKYLVLSKYVLYNNLQAAQCDLVISQYSLMMQLFLFIGESNLFD